MVAWPMTSRDPQRCCEAVRSAILATAWLLVVVAILYRQSPGGVYVCCWSWRRCHRDTYRQWRWWINSWSSRRARILLRTRATTDSTSPALWPSGTLSEPPYSIRLFDMHTNLLSLFTGLKQLMSDWVSSFLTAHKHIEGHFSHFSAYKWYGD